MSQEIQQLRKSIFDELTKIVDPEIGVSIMELELIDKVDIEEGKGKNRFTPDKPLLSCNIWF